MIYHTGAMGFLPHLRCPDCPSGSARIRWCVPEKQCERRRVCGGHVLSVVALVALLAALGTLTVLAFGILCRPDQGVQGVPEGDGEGDQTPGSQQPPADLPDARILARLETETGELRERGVLPDSTTWFVPGPLPLSAPLSDPLSDPLSALLSAAPPPADRTKRAVSPSRMWDVLLSRNHSAPSDVQWGEEVSGSAGWRTLGPSAKPGTAEEQLSSDLRSDDSSVDAGPVLEPGAGRGDLGPTQLPPGPLLLEELVWRPSRWEGPQVTSQMLSSTSVSLLPSASDPNSRQLDANDVPGAAGSSWLRPTEAPGDGDGVADSTDAALGSNGTATDTVPESSSATESSPTAPEEDGHAVTASTFQDDVQFQADADSIRTARARMMLEYMDQAANPCTDFYSYACGGWARRHPIPRDKAAFDTFEILRESLDTALRHELEDLPPLDLAAPTPTSTRGIPGEPGSPGNESSDAQADKETFTAAMDATLKAKYLYKSCMNYEVLSARGVRPLLELLDALGGWPVLDATWETRTFDWVNLMARLRLYNNDVLISEWVGPDVKSSDEYVVQLDQTALGLPTRDYFLKASNAAYLQAYRAFLVEVCTLLGAAPATAEAQAGELVAFETELAQIVSSSEDRRNVSQLYQRLTLGELCDLVPAVDWRRYLRVVLSRPMLDQEPVVVFAMRYIHDLVQLVDKTPPRVVANYLLWRFVRHRINNLDDRFLAAKQRLFHALFGREAEPPRWKTCVTHVNTHMGMAVGALFVRKYFDHNSKLDTLEMTQAIMASFRDMLNSTDWIDPETRRLALHKVESMQLRIGYPDFLLDDSELNDSYKDVVVHPDRYFENTLSILTHMTRVEQARLGSAVNKTLWKTPPAVVNAYYSRNKNQIMFPAGILQPPFYHRHLPRSLNYGGIGVVIGHEITHGFDDKGRLFDEHGNLFRWWGDQAIDNFHSRAKCLINQYSQYTVSEIDLVINGENTQGENIADNGGIKQAFRAYQRWIVENGDSNETLPGVNATGMQLFFLNFAQVWCGTMRPEAMRNKLKIAVHSPARFRVIGTLSNSKEFAEVFNCPAGSPMNPTEKCSVW